MIEYPSGIVLVMDGGDQYLIPGADTMANLKGALDEDWATLTLERACRHNNTANVAFVDGHVKAEPRNWLFNVNQPPSNLPYNIYVSPQTIPSRTPLLITRRSLSCAARTAYCLALSA